MPVRVRCRCGQELHLRYGDWVYVLLGLVLLCIALNSLALLLIFFHVEKVSERIESAAGSPTAGARDRSESATAASGRSVENRRGASRRIRKGRDTSAAPPVDTSTSAADATSPSASERPVQGTKVESAPAGEPVSGEVPPAEPVARIVETAVDGAEANGESGAADDRTVDPLAGEVPSPAPRGPFAGEAPLVRLLLLEEAPGGLDWRFGFFLDEDIRLRRRALERLRSYSARVASRPPDSDAYPTREWLRVLRGALGASPDGGRLLSELTALFPHAPIEDGAPDGPSLALPALLASNSRIGETFLREAPAKSMRDGARKIAADGLDCVLLMDVSQSMESVLGPARREIARSWSILSWGLPGIRLGILLYRDHVVDVLDFSVGVDEQIARLGEVEASGGGDVPEGLHLAIKRSLGLGEFDWRPDATKHLIVLSDAPPPFSEQPGLASLVRGARRQAGFSVHALGVNPEDGRESVPFFSELAEAGGGRARTVDPSRICSEVFLCLQPALPPDVLEPLLASADRLLSM